MSVWDDVVNDCRGALQAEAELDRRDLDEVEVCLRLPADERNTSGVLRGQWDDVSTTLATAWWGA